MILIIYIFHSRSDGQLRHTSTSTSNYNTSASDMPAYLRGFDSSLHTRKDGKHLYTTSSITRNSFQLHEIIFSWQTKDVDDENEQQTEKLPVKLEKLRKQRIATVTAREAWTWRLVTLQTTTRPAQEGPAIHRLPTVSI